MLQDLTPGDLANITTAIAGVCALLTVLGLLLVRRLVRAFESATHLKVPAQAVTQLEGFARLGAGYVEELMRKYVLGLVSNAPRTPQEKEHLAVQTARSLAPDGLATFSDEQVAIAVQASLPSIRPVVEAAQPVIAGSRSLVPKPASIIPSSPRIPSDLGPTTFLDTDVETSPQTPKAKRVD
jgi:hypothetical protein